MRACGEARGFTIIELLVAIIVMSIGVLAVFRLFPASVRGQAQDRMQTMAGYFAQEKLEQLGCAAWDDPALTAGHHPLGSDEPVGSSNQWARSYEVKLMAPPMDDLKRVAVTVTWSSGGGRQVTVSAYRRKGS